MPGFAKSMQRSVIFICLLIAAVGCSSESSAERPNIILMLADDLGHGDLSSFGSPAVQTPSLDQLAADGLAFQNFYAAAAVCTPTRASIMTGRYPLRFDITYHFNDVDGYLPEEALTVAELLKDAGYNTAHIGKWHLGGLHLDENGQRMNDQPGPGQHGFDYYLTQVEQQPERGVMMRNRVMYREGGTSLVRDGQRVGEDDPYYPMHLTDVNGEHTIAMIEKLNAADEPFYINLWWNVPHVPLEPAPEPHWSDTAAEGISDDQHRFRSMVQHMDARIGDILAKLDELGIADNTLVLFTSDNGGAYEAYIGDLKGGKTDLHDGGLRVPTIVRWPSEVTAGQVTQTFGHTNDILPTFIEAAGVELPETAEIDGLSLLSHLRGGPAPSNEERGMMFYQMDLYEELQRHYRKPEPYATEVVMQDNWKMLARDGVPVELFDILADPNEVYNVMDEHPKQVRAMVEELVAWLAEERIRN